MLLLEMNSHARSIAHVPFSTLDRSRTPPLRVARTYWFVKGSSERFWRLDILERRARSPTMQPEHSIKSIKSAQSRSKRPNRLGS